MATLLVNTVPYDFQSVEVELIARGTSVLTFGIVDGIEGFDVSWKINRTKFYGRGRLPLDMTEGDAEFDASLSLHQYWYHYLSAKAAELGLGLADLRMFMSLNYFGKLPDGSSSDPHNMTVTGARWNSGKHTGKHGADPLMWDMGLDVLNVYMDGRDVFGNPGP
jgi:hypothetical protein